MFCGLRYAWLLRSKKGGQLSTACDAELAVRRVQVAFDRPHRNNQALGNLGVGLPVSGQGGDLLLPSRQRREAWYLGMWRDECERIAGLRGAPAECLSPGSCSA